ncbi:hypothetical protein JTB14_019771 [Gonioctena quinquepunctata]|nr:hypothetical protein JTB14_019771 [Gonioctena quinquepunctata]
MESVLQGITTHKRKKGQDSSSGSDGNDNHDKIGVPQSAKVKGNTEQSSNSPAASVNIAAPDYSSPSTSEQACAVNPKISKNDGWHENDIGCYVGPASQLTVEKKKELLQNSWVPPRNYDFETDASHLRRKFNHAWLDRYAPRLVIHKVQEVHEDCQKHVNTNIHLNATAAAEAFLENIPVDVQMQSHKFNLVVNVANKVPEIENTIATIEVTINFFRESTVRRNCAPNLSRMCETRWSEKYESIRTFSQNSPELLEALEKLCTEGNYDTRKSAFQMHSAVTKPLFIIAFITIAKYSLVLEPVVLA